MYFLNSKLLINRTVNRLISFKQFKKQFGLNRELSSYSNYNRNLNSVLFLSSNGQLCKNVNINFNLINLRFFKFGSNAKQSDRNGRTINEKVKDQLDDKQTDGIKNNPIFNLDEEDKEREKEKERLRTRQVRVTKITFFVFCGIFTGAVIWALVNWGLPKYDEQGNLIIDRFSEYSLPKQVILRTFSELINVKEDFTGPSRELLLPPPLTYPYMQPPYTLVLELKSLLVHFDWDYQHGWGCSTRPYLKKFLEQVGPPTFEIVIFTELQPFTAFGILETIDKEGFIMHRLFKDSTRHINGKNIKDLNILNRDLSKTIQIEVDRDACSLNPRNCLVLEKWLGDTSDTTLIDLAIFLRTIASQNVEDVRDIISHYSQFDKPLEVFRQNQQRMLEEEEKRHKKPAPLASLVKKRI